MIIVVAQQQVTSVPLEAVAITAGAVVLAALIAAFAAHFRQRNQAAADLNRLKEQLDADGKRLDQRLDAEQRRLEAQLADDRARFEAQLAEERARLDTQLAHDRHRLEMQLAEERLRQKAQLDHDLEMGLRHERQRRENQFRDSCADAGGALAAYLRALDDARTSLRGTKGLQVGHIEALNEHAQKLWEHEDRLAVWLGQVGDEIATFRYAQHKLNAAQTVLYEVDSNSGMDSERATEFRAARQSAYEAQRRFLDLVSKRVGLGVGKSD